MAYDEKAAERVRKALGKRFNAVEKKMFGGVAFMIRGNMACGVLGDKLMLRVGPEDYEKALSLPHARKMDFTGKPMKGMIYIETAGFASDGDLEKWLSRATQFVRSLPAK